jgi:hypothetical protein
MTNTNLFLRFEQICKIHRCSITFTKEDGPYYLDGKRRIIFCPSHFPTQKWKIKVFCHELAHHFQNSLDTFKPNNQNLSELLTYELDADRLAYFICLHYFSEFKIHHRTYICYQNREEVDFLRRWYGL